MKILKGALGALVLLLFSLQLQAQHTPNPPHEVNEHSLKHFRCSVVLNHAYVGKHTSSGKEYMAVPALGFDAEYWFNHRWGIGLHNDLEILTQEVHRDGEHLFERNSPVLLTMDGLWKPSRHLVFLIGPGVELEEHEAHMVLRGGIEYEIELSSHWDIAPTVFYDTRLHAYDTFSFGIGIGKRF
ncbi:hypothetical protein FVR03_20945 [Pontibacter qinzhouensis]|uniref:Porin family protein n=1 Tax=Pontibacter qinzhouensis TaxID=2603253 RepID=A0A5C8J1L5_9BACT|nr:hypothetical protein [Pontibacter qinzhouensis]TXK28258.1 hypothetical protein FVR03_20945 [Pontibacter qinzhouensis]